MNTSLQGWVLLHRRPSGSVRAPKVSPSRELTNRHNYQIDASSADAAVATATCRAQIAASIEFGRQCYQPEGYKMEQRWGGEMADKKEGPRASETEIMRFERRIARIGIQHEAAERNGCGGTQFPSNWGFLLPRHKLSSLIKMPHSSRLFLSHVVLAFSLCISSCLHPFFEGFLVRYLRPLLGVNKDPTIRIRV